MPNGNFWIADSGISLIVVNFIINFLKLHVLDNIMDPKSAMYNVVTRGLIFVLNLVANAIGYVLSGGSWAGAWAIIVAGLASTGVNFAGFHYGRYVNNRRVASGSQPIPAVGTVKPVYYSGPVDPNRVIPPAN